MGISASDAVRASSDITQIVGTAARLVPALNEFRGCAGTWKLENWWAAGDRSWKGSWAHSTWQVKAPLQEQSRAWERSARAIPVERAELVTRTAHRGYYPEKDKEAEKYCSEKTCLLLSFQERTLVVADVFALRENMNCTFKRKQNLAEWWMFRNFHKEKVMIDSQLKRSKQRKLFVQPNYNKTYVFFRAGEVLTEKYWFGNITWRKFLPLRGRYYVLWSF